MPEFKRGDVWEGEIYFYGHELRGINGGWRKVTAKIGDKWAYLTIGTKNVKTRRVKFEEMLATEKG